MKQLVKFIFALILSNEVSGGETNFPDDFIFGASTSAYQVEGAWNVSNKGESIWDRMTHEKPENIDDKSNGDIAADSYYSYKEDIKLLEQIGANAYRMSISWSRIFPDGFNNSINREGIEYYNNVIDEMLKKNITPFITIYHWDLPQKLQDLGGWENSEISDWFVDYARVVFNEFGDKVKNWITLNEPNMSCLLGYLGILAPAIDKSGQGDYMCGHNALLAHAKAYKMYQQEFYKKQKGKVGIVITTGWLVPENAYDPEEVAVAKLAWDFWYGWLLHPIFSNKGDYSENMKERIANYSSIQGFSKSRLPKLTQEEIELVKNSSDFLGMNFYSALYVTKMINYDIKNVSTIGDIGIDISNKTSTNDRCTPWAFTNALKYTNREYNIPEFYITENGYWDVGGTNDLNRTEYYLLHLNEVSKLVKEGIKIRGYFAWSLLDNFEWSVGYTQKYGLFSVDFSDPGRPRTEKLSSKLITQIYKSKIVPSYFLTGSKNITIY